MKWLKTMSKDELREAYEKVTNEEDLQEFENHCHNIGVQIHKAVKDLNDRTKEKLNPRDIAYLITSNAEILDAMSGLVNHSLKMMDK